MLGIEDRKVPPPHHMAHKLPHAALPRLGMVERQGWIPLKVSLSTICVALADQNISALIRFLHSEACSLSGSGLLRALLGGRFLQEVGLLFQEGKLGTRSPALIELLPCM